MGRIATIENTAASGLPLYNNLKVIVRGRPRFIDPQLDGGSLRFAIKRGFNLSTVIPDNQSELAENAYKDSTRVVMTMRPRWMSMGTLVRIGNSEAVGEMHRVIDTVDSGGIELNTPLVANYSSSTDQSTIPVVSLVGTPCKVYKASDDPSRVIMLESWYRIMPSDILLTSGTPEVLESLQEYTIRRADFVATHSGDAGMGEPTFVYRYEIELATKTGLLPFVPAIDLILYLKAYPLFFRSEWGVGDIELPADVGPCVLDVYSGSLLDTNVVTTRLGIQFWDSFGFQINSRQILSGSITASSKIVTVGSTALLSPRQIVVGNGIPSRDIHGGTSLVDTIIEAILDSTTIRISQHATLTSNNVSLSFYIDQQWREIKENHLILERPISSDSLLFWQRIVGNFQFQKNGFFQAELNDEGRFTFSTGLLVPQWPSDHEYGWVIPLFCRSAVKATVQFEPQEVQVFDIPSNTLTFIRPKVRVDPTGQPIQRLIMSFTGSPNSRVEIRDWQYDGSAIISLSYYILGTGDAYSQKRWLAGGLCVKPLFYNLGILKARYSDGVSHYNSGNIYI